MSRASDRTSRWFRIPEVGSGTEEDPLRPKYVADMDVDWTGNVDREKPPAMFYCRVYGSKEAIRRLQMKPQAVRFRRPPAEALNQATGLTETGAGHEKRFQVSRPGP